MRTLDRTAKSEIIDLLTIIRGYAELIASESKAPPEQRSNARLIIRKSDELGEKLGLRDETRDPNAALGANRE